MAARTGPGPQPLGRVLEALVPPGVNNGIQQTVGEPEDGQRARDGKLQPPAEVLAGGGIAQDEHGAGDEIWQPRHDEAARRQHDHLDGLAAGGVLSRGGGVTSRLG